MSSDSSSQPTPESIALLASSDYVEQMYEQWQSDPSSMSEEWRLFFSGFDLAVRPTGAVASERASDQSKVVSLIFAYRNLGHLIADLDPLGDNLESHPLLKLETFGLGPENLDEVYDTGHLGGPKQATLREIQ